MKRNLLIALAAMFAMSAQVNLAVAQAPTKLKVCHIRHDGSAWVIEINEDNYARYYAMGDRTLINPDLLNVHDACTPGVD